jgi:hypothetical protein
MVPSVILKTRECICFPSLHEKLYTITYSLNNIQGGGQNSAPPPPKKNNIQISGSFSPGIYDLDDNSSHKCMI